MFWSESFNEWHKHKCTSIYYTTTHTHKRTDIRLCHYTRMYSTVRVHIVQYYNRKCSSVKLYTYYIYIKPECCLLPMYNNISTDTLIAIVRMPFRLNQKNKFSWMFNLNSGTHYIIYVSFTPDFCVCFCTYLLYLFLHWIHAKRNGSMHFVFNFKMKWNLYTPV